MTQFLPPTSCPAGERIVITADGLHPDLLPFVDPLDRPACHIRHPFYRGHLGNARFNREASQQYLAVRADADRARAEKCWVDYVNLHATPYQFHALFGVADRMADRDFWSLFASVWTFRSPGPRWRREVDALFASGRPGREAMMDGRERAFLAALPDPVTVYCGHQGKNRRGYSWTLSYGRARWFSRRHPGGRPGVLRATAAKADILAVLLGRSEFEVVVVPEQLQGVQPVRRLRRPQWAEAILTEATAAFRPPVPFTDHGPWHWEAVERNVLALAPQVAGADARVARLFALLHDAKREHETDDPDHGRRAAAFVKKLHRAGKLDIDRRQSKVLAAACAGHADGGVSPDPTIGLCWDAGRLDLMRVGTLPDPALLSTPAARDLLFRI